MTDEQRANLHKLADYLDIVAQKRFDMFDYARYRGRASEKPADREVLHCSTVCCALGNGPRAGIPALVAEYWWTYSSRAFGLRADSGAWDWCFDLNWRYIDNTPRGAAARIRWLLAHGLPSDYRKQMYGDVPLYYVEEIVS